MNAFIKLTASASALIAAIALMWIAVNYNKRVNKPERQHIDYGALLSR